MDEINSMDSPIIYEMDSSSEDQKQIKSDLSTSSKSNDNKKHQQDTQVSDISQDNFQGTQIIKIKPYNDLSPQILQNQLPSISYPNEHKLLQQIIFNEENIDKLEYKQDDQIQQPPRKQNKRRKRQLSPTAKRRLKHQKNHLLDNDDQLPTKQQQFDEHVMQITLGEKLPSYLQLQDSERYFDIKKKFKCDNEKKNVSQQYSLEVEVECKDQEVYQLNDSEQVDQQQEKMHHNQIKATNNDQNQRITVLRKLPKQIVVQTTIQTLVMNPVGKGLKLSCTFIIDKKYLGLSTQYNFVINSANNKTVLSAKKEHFSFMSSNFIISLNQNYITKRKDNLGFVGRLSGNFAGTVYELSKRERKNIIQSTSKNNDFNDNDDKQKKVNENLQAIIKFQNNLWGYGGMRKMEIIKLNRERLTQKDKLKGANFQQVYERGQMSKLMKIQTSKPAYNKSTKRYSINFGNNKVKIPSTKNMVLQYQQSCNNKDSRKVEQIKQNKSSENNVEKRCFLMGKQKDDRYLVEVSYPLSLYEAFAACLANNDLKLLVS